MKKINLLKEPSLLARYEAFPYQKEAFESVKDLEYAAIFHEQGLGKTKIAIDLLLYWLKETSIDTVMVVTKKQLVANWNREFQTHTAIKPAVLSSNHNDNFRIFCGRDGLSGNLCRCTGYTAIIRAVLRAAKELSGKEPEKEGSD